MRRKIDVDSIKEIASGLGELNHKSVFVGGAVVSLYVDDPAADEARPTKDIDIALEIVTLGQLEKIRQELAARGFFPDPEEQVVCRFVYKGILVDVMSTKETGWAPANTWFKEGFRYLQTITLDGGISIQILTLAYFLASKFDVYHSRGKDPRTSCLLIQVCEKNGLPAYLERSRSGKGGHVWLFFERPYPAIKSRKIMFQLMEQAGLISAFDKNSSFDRVFPNQDYLSGKGFGNLIALPLNKICVEQGYNCFIRPESCEPYGY